MLSILHRYVLRELAKSFVMSFLALVAVMVLGSIYRPLRMGLSFADLLRFLPYLLPYLLAWVVPATLLAACVMTYGRLSAENELMACGASGIPLRYMCYPAFLFGLALTAAAIPLNDTLIPRTRALREDLLRRAFLEQPFRITMLGGQETITIGPYKIYVESIQDDRLNNVIVVAPNVDADAPGAPAGAGHGAPKAAEAPDAAAASDRGHRPRDRAAEVRVYRARAARYSVNEVERTIRIALQDAQYTVVVPDRSAVSWINATADQQVVIIPTDDPSEKLRERRATATTTELLQRARAQRRELARATSPEQRSRWRKQLGQTFTEVHLREALAFSSLALCLVGVPLGIWMRRESRLASFAAAVLVFIMLYAMIISGEGLAEGGKLPPRIALWAPDAITGAFGVGLLLRMFRR